VPSQPIRVLWLYGPRSAGKTTTGWEIYRSLPPPGCGYLDIDQLGMCYPVPDDDRHRDRLKAEALGKVLTNFHAHGARLVILSGILDPALLPLYEDQAPVATFTFCRMTASSTELRRRHLARGEDETAATQVIADAERLDHARHAHVTVDTTTAGPAEAARRVVQLTALSAPASPTRTSTGRPLAPSSARGRVIFLIGPPVVGKSVVGWSLFGRARARAVTGFVDLAQVGFLRPAPEDDADQHRFKAANVAALWSTFHAWGSHALVVNGAVPDPHVLRLYRQALPGADVVAIRLRAGPLELARRLMRRAHGHGVKLPGDRPLDRSPQWCRRELRAVLAQAEALDRHQPGDAVVDTDGLTIEEVAERVADVVGAPFDGSDLDRPRPPQLSREQRVAGSG
jgi:hypothetical protein